MPSLAAPITVYAGDSLSMTFRFSNSSGVLDLATGWSWRSQWKSKTSSDPSIELTVVTTNALTGVLVIKGTPAQTTGMSSNGVYDLQGTNVDGRVWTALWGNTMGMKDVTI